MRNGITSENASDKLHVCRDSLWDMGANGTVVIGYVVSALPIFSFVLNAVALIRINGVGKLKTNTRYILLSSIVCDMCMSVAVMPFRASMLVTYPSNTQWARGILCDVGNSADVMLSAVAVFHMSVLVFDRYVISCHPFHIDYWFSRSQMIRIFVFCWCFPAAMAFGFIPTRVAGSHIDHVDPCLFHHGGSCGLVTNTPYAVMMSMLSFFIPALLTYIWSLHIRKAVATRNAIFSKLLQVYTRAGYRNRRHIGIHLAKTVLTMACAFFVCRCPVYVITILDPVIGYRVPDVVWISVRWVCYVGSAINPFLYLRLSGTLSHR